MNRLLFWITESAQHRTRGDAVTAAYAEGFTARHCAGGMGGGFCLAHDHPGEAPMQLFVTGIQRSAVG